MPKKYFLTLFYSLLILVGLFSSNLCSQSILSPSDSNQIRLGSFNIEKLGKANPYQAKNAAEILKNYDIVAIQEVMNTGATKTNPIGTKGIEALKNIVNYLGEDWAFIGFVFIAIHKSVFKKKIKNEK
ncbi:MAG: hypothetical protein AB1393_06255 [Candidatus Edwardsbacteria bacterium]